MTLLEAENSIIEEFSMYEEWLDKYEYLIELGKSLKDFPESAKIEDKLIKGCQSRVWLDYRIENGKVIFNADSDAIITKGIISLHFAFPWVPLEMHTLYSDSYCK